MSEVISVEHVNIKNTKTPCKDLCIDNEINIIYYQQWILYAVFLLSNLSVLLT